MERIDLVGHIQNARFNGFHLRLVVIGFLLIMFDGYDVAVYGAITPALMDDWGISAVEAGAIGSAGLVGMLIGAILFGTLADRFGRKRIVITTVVLYCLFTALCGFATGPIFFMVCRLIAGLGLGGVMPNLIAMLTDFSPKRHSATIVTVVLTGFAAGGLLAPILGIVVIPAFGWQVSMWIAAIPLLFVPLLFKFLPESFSVLLRTGRTDQARSQLRQIDPEPIITDHTEIVLEQRADSKLPLTHLFTEGRTASTLMFWLAFFANLLAAYGFLNWLPKLMMDRGFNLQSSLLFLGVFQIGGIIGTLGAGRWADRFGAKKILLAMYLTGTVVITGVALSTNVSLTYVFIGIAGAILTGVQNLAQVYVAQYYPPYVRSTALGSASGVGRAGGILGPMIGGVLLSLSFSNQTIFCVLAIPGIIAAIAIALVREQRSFQATGSTNPEADTAPVTERVA